MKRSLLLALLLYLVGSTRIHAQNTQPVAAASNVGSTPSSVSADSAATPKAAEKPAAVTVVTSAGEGGFQLKASDNNFSLRIRGDVQTDGRFFTEDPNSSYANTFYLRRVRAAFQGNLFSMFEYRLMTDFGNSSAQLLDAYLSAKLSPALGVQVGKFKEPVGLERLQSVTDIMFIELGLPTGLVPNRDVGIMLFGNLLGDRVEYQAGVFNGVTDGASEDIDQYDSKDLAGRIFISPFKSSKSALVKGLGFGVAATVGTQKGSLTSPSLPQFRTSGRRTFFRYRTGADAAATALADGDRTRIAPQAYYYAGPIGLLTEYVRVEQDLVLGGNSQALTHEAYQVAASVVLTGEKATYKRLTPSRPFDWKRGQYGAFEVVGRIQGQQLDDATFPTFADPAHSALKTSSWGVGLNWYLNASVRFMVNYEQTTFDAAAGAAKLEKESLLLTRFQIVF